jgi:hypothetical protein
VGDSGREGEKEALQLSFFFSSLTPLFFSRVLLFSLLLLEDRRVSREQCVEVEGQFVVGGNSM